MQFIRLVCKQGVRCRGCQVQYIKEGLDELEGGKGGEWNYCDFLDVIRDSIGVVLGVIFASDWIVLAADTTGMSCSIHHSGGILIVGDIMSSTRSQKKAKICPSVFVALVKGTGICYTSHMTLIWRCGPSITTISAGHSSMARYTSVSIRDLYYGMDSTLKRSKILGCACMVRYHCCAVQTALSIERGPRIGCAGIWGDVTEAGVGI